MGHHLLSRAPSAWLTAARSLLLIFLLLVPVVFWRGAVEPFESCKATLLHLVALLLAGCFAGAGRLPGGRFWREPLGAALLLGLLSAVVSTLFSLSPRTSLWGAWESQFGLLTFASLMMLFLASRSLLGREDIVSTLPGFVGVAIVLVGGYAALQVIGTDPLAWVETSAYAGFTRPIGTMGHPNYLAGLLVMALPLLVLGAVGQDRRWWFAIPVLLALIALVTSLSRAAWLAGSVLFVLPLVTLRGRTRWLVLGGVGCAALVAFVLARQGMMGPVGERIRNLSEASSRLAIWDVSWHAFLDRPLTGNGLDAYQLAFTRHRTTEYWRHEWGFTPTRAHNEPLHILATQGALGGLANLALLAATGVASWRAWKTGQRGIVLALLGVSASYHIQNLFGFPVIATASLHAVALGCLSRLADANAVDELVPSSRWPLLVATGLAGIVLPANVLLTTSEIGKLCQVGVLALLALAWAVRQAANRRRHEVAFPTPRWAFPTARVALVAVAVLVAGWFVTRPLAAWCAVRQGQELLGHAPQRALVAFENATALAPWLDAPYSHLANARHRFALQRGDHDLFRAAARAAATARDRVPASAVHHAAVARITLDLIRIDGVADEPMWRSFDEALRHDPRNTVILLDAGRAALTLGQTARARGYLERALALDPHLPPLLAEFGILALAEGRAVEAERTLDQAVKGDWRGQHDALGRAYGLLALACLQHGNYPGALLQAEHALTRWPSPNTFEVATRWVRAAALEQSGRLPEARDEVLRILALRPDHAQARVALERLSR